MIPKIIHYCWFGKKELPELAKKCIESWKKYCPDYEIIEWNEDNFDINMNCYVKEAYQNKKYAFVADVARLYALYNYGGIYMDTDVEVIKNLDEFLKNLAFSGFEQVDRIPTGIMGCQKKNSLFKEFLDYYDNRHFSNEDGKLDMTTNVAIITNIMEKYGLVKDNKLQIVNGFTLYPNDFFCPFNYDTNKLNITSNTATIHWFSGSWQNPMLKFKSKMYKYLKRNFGQKFITKLVKIKKKIIR